MKKLFKIGLVGVLLLSTALISSCKHYVDTLSIAGYSYKLTKMTSLEDSSSVEFQVDDFLDPFSGNAIDSSKLQFNKDGSTAYITFGDKKYSGKYSVNTTDKIITLSLDNYDPWFLVVVNNAATLELSLKFQKDSKDVSFKYEYKLQ